MSMRTFIDLTEDTIFETLTDAEIMEARQSVNEKAPPGKKAKRFIKRLAPDFKKRYGDAWKQVLYATAWKNFG